MYSKGHRVDRKGHRVHRKDQGTHRYMREGGNKCVGHALKAEKNVQNIISGVVARHKCCKGLGHWAQLSGLLQEVLLAR
jgi:hypothetical protein